MTVEKPERRIDFAVTRLARGWTSELTQRIPGKKGRRVVTVHHDPLIGMLRSRTLGTSGTGTTDRGAANTRSVVDDDAITKMRELRTDIETLWANLLPGAMKLGILRRPPVPLESALAGWHNLFTIYHAAGLVHDTELRRAARVTSGWVNTIEAKFDPIDTLPFHAPCPVCSERWATVGDGILATRVDAIALTSPGALADAIAVCRACGATWKGHQQLVRLNSGQAPSPSKTPHLVAQAGTDTA